MSDLFELQNGSDVRGVAMEVPGGPAVNLTPQTAGRIAAAFVQWLAAKTGVKANTLSVGVGTDSRKTAGSISEEILRAIAGQGAAAYGCGMCSTPAMFMGTQYPAANFSGSIMVTASHLPQERNGMKFFTKEGGLDKGDIRAILELAQDIAPGGAAATDAPAPAKPFDLMALYTESLRAIIRRELGGDEKPLSGLHIVVDAGNGAGGFFATAILQPLGANCTGSVFLEPDGTFPGHMPNPENAEAMASIKNAVLASGADLGVIFDTDVDRMSAVLPDGSEVNRDAIIAMMAAILAPQYPGATIVTDSITSHHLTAFLNGLGMRHHRFKRGYRNVIREAQRLTAEGTLTPLAIETSGHGALSENYFLDDGAYMAVKIVIAAARAKRDGTTLESLIAALGSPAERAERRIPIAGANFAAYADEVLAAFEAQAKAQGIGLEESYEGVRLGLDGGWMLLRKSLHEPLLPLNVESDEAGGVAAALALAKKMLLGFDRLDLSVLD